MNGVSTNTFKTKLTHTDTTEAVYTPPVLQIEIASNKDATHPDTQDISDGQARFFITITNTSPAGTPDAAVDNISVTDTLFPACKRDWKAIKALMVAQGK